MVGFPTARLHAVRPYHAQGPRKQTGNELLESLSDVAEGLRV